MRNLVVDKAEFESFTIEKLLALWPENAVLHGVILFGSRAAATPAPDADWDIGLIYDRILSDIETPDSWDIFFWNLEHWKRGFVLQMELARKSKILFDPEGIIQERIAFIQKQILPHWARYLKRT